MQLMRSVTTPGTKLRLLGANSFTHGTSSLLVQTGLRQYGDLNTAIPLACQIVETLNKKRFRNSSESFLILLSLWYPKRFHFFLGYRLRRCFFTSSTIFDAFFFDILKETFISSFAICFCIFLPRLAQCHFSIRVRGQTEYRLV